MKNRKKNNDGFKFIYIFLILVFAAGISFLAMSFFVPKKEPAKDTDTTLNTVVNDNEVKKTTNEEEEVEPDAGEENTDKTPRQYEGAVKADPATINAGITKNEVVDGKYLLRITIYEELSGGTCQLHMETAKGDTLDRSASIINAGADSSSCEGFDIPTEGISQGTYNFSVKLTSGSKSTTITGVIKI